MINEPRWPADTHREPGALPVLAAFLTAAREAVIAKATGVTEDQGRTPGVDSGTSLYGLIRHLTAAETYWFEVILLGVDHPVDLGMDVPATATGPDLIAGYRAAAARSDANIAASGDPLALSTGTRQPPRTLQWIVAHMIQETARHAGHADILREQIDDTTGHKLRR
ncbi:DinB family protein [Longispora urticae]